MWLLVSTEIVHHMSRQVGEKVNSLRMKVGWDRWILCPNLFMFTQIQLQWL